MPGGKVSGSESAGKFIRIAGGDSDFTCVVLRSSAAGSGLSHGIVEALREYLSGKGIRLQLLSDYTYHDGHYAERLEELVHDCMFGILVTDDAGPGEIYQAGFLKGSGKSVFSLGRDAPGVWEVIGLSSDPHPAPAGSFSCRDMFLMRPLPLPARTGWDAVSGENTDTDLMDCLGTALHGIIGSYIAESLPDSPPEGQEALREYAVRLSVYFSSREGFGLPELDAIYEALGAWEEMAGLGAPSRMRSCLASLYSGLADGVADEETVRVCAGRCVSLYESILEREERGTLAGLTAKKLADLLVSGASAGSGAGDLERAAGLYRHALGIFASELYPREFAAVSNNLGAALNLLYSKTADPCYVREAAEVLEACVSQGVFLDPQPDIALVNVNLGSAYASLALHENPRGNYLEAAGALEDALGLFEAHGERGERAAARAALGDIYKTLGDAEAESDNPEAAIEFYDRSLLHYPEEAVRGVHASNGRKLGEAFERLYRKGRDTADLRKSIAAFSAALSAEGDAGGDGCEAIARTLTSLYSELAETLESSGDYESAVEGMKGALSVFDPAGRPLEYALAHVRIGGLYSRMAAREERELNTELAVESYKEALSLIDEESCGDMRMELRGLAGGLLAGLARAEGADPNKRVGYYREALDYLSPDGHARDYALAQKGLGDVYMELYRKAGESELPSLAAAAFGEALRVLTAEEFAEEYGEAETALGEALGVISEIEMAESSESVRTGGPGGVSVDDAMSSEKPVLTLVKDDETEGAGEPEDPEEAVARLVEKLRTVSKSESPAEYASLMLLLGRSYMELGERGGEEKGNYFRRALRACEESLGCCPPYESPHEYAGASMCAAHSWMRISEQTGDVRGFERAISSYREALSVITPDSSPREWGAAKESIGNIYRALAEMRGDTGSYRKALAEYKEALAVFTPEESLSDYGRIEKSIGLIHGILAGLEDGGRDYAEAVKAFSGALRAYGPGSSPAEYAEIHKFMGIALAGIARKEGSPEYYRRAVESWGEALGIAGRETQPRDYGLIMKNAGAAYESLYGFSDDPADLRSAVQSYEDALGYYTYEFMPAEYASISSGLGAVYKRLSETEDPDLNCRKALRCFGGALRVYNVNDYPLEYAATQHNIGIVYRMLGEQEEKGKNCKRAVNAYREALRVYTEKEHPAQYGSTKYSLGTAYMTLAEVEEKETNCRMAVRAFEDALRVRTIKDYPMQFAATQNNLGVVYRMLSEAEDRVKNCRKAIKAYETALEIYTIDRFPIQYATTQNNIGGAYTTLAGEEDRTRNCDKAAQAYTEALKVFTKNSYPEQYGIVKANLELLSEFSGTDVSSAAS